MKKIGIVTYHKAWNNGAFLQALAMQMFLETHGFEAYIVNTGIRYKSVVMADTAANEWWREYEKVLADCHRLLYESSEKKYDAIIYGSDEIWNLRSYGANPIFWGYRLNSPRKIAYAPCSGELGMKICFKSPCKALMVAWALNNNYQAVSARDDRTKKFIKIFSSREVTECLDPTFLADFTPYKSGNTRGNYIVVYSYGLNAETIKGIREFAAAHDCKIVYTGSYSDWADENPVLDPMEWLNVMFHARYVFTSTFHGCVFSVICRRSFFVVETNSSKVNDLLMRLQLTDRKVRDFNSLPPEVDYTVVQQHLGKQRQVSEDYILSNI